MTKFQQNIHETFPEQANVLLALFTGERSPDTFPSVAAWTGQCYHTPTYHERFACAINEALGGYGVEAIFRDGASWPDVEYINLGDTYTPTLVYLASTRKWRVACWGDIVEQLGL